MSAETASFEPDCPPEAGCPAVRMRWGPAAICALILALLCPAAPAGQDRRKGQREGEDLYKKWLDQDVRYIITDDERAVFRKLSTDEERDAFIEQFWARRDPDPRTSENECKEEHYRRIAYANDHFTSGIDGWATDRGRIYIMFGKPDGIEDHPGGRYNRSIPEGGGTTSTYAFRRVRRGNDPFQRNVLPEQLPGWGASALSLDKIPSDGGS